MYPVMLKVSRVVSMALLTMLSAQGTPPTAQQAEGNRNEEQRREQRERVSDVLARLEVKEGARVADIGAGSGFYTVRLARLVGPTGRVVAVDIDSGALDRLRRRVSQEHLPNVDIVYGKPDDPLLQAQSFDAVLIVHAYHEMTEHQAMLRHIREALKLDGRLVVVELLDTTLRESTRDQQAAKHSLEAGYVLHELRDAGFAIVALQDPFVRVAVKDEEWLVVALPSTEAEAVTTGGIRSLSDNRSLRDKRSLKGNRSPGGNGSSHVSAPAAPARPAAADPLDDPALRMPLQDFKVLWLRDAVLVVDVRDEESYRAGHIPHAASIPLDDLGQRLAQLQQERRPIVTYCS